MRRVLYACATTRQLARVPPSATSTRFLSLFSFFRRTVEGNDSASSAQEEGKMPKAAFYAVASGRKPGVYRTWAECEAQVKGFGRAVYKKFTSDAEARKFIANAKTTRNPYAKPDAAAVPACTPREAPAATSAMYDGPPMVGAMNGGPPVVGSVSTPGKKSQDKDAASSSATTTAKTELPPNFAALAADGWIVTDSPPHRLVVYTDGSSLGNGKRGASAGAGVHWGAGEAAKYNLAERVPGDLQTNNRGELLSIIRAIEMCPFPELPLEIRTDSQYSIQCMTVYLPKWMRNGWKTKAGAVKNADMIRHLTVLLRRRKAPVRFKHVRGHVGHAGNEAADALARQGAVQPRCERDDWLDPEDDDPEELPEEGIVEVDPDWLMDEAEMAAFEQELKEE